MTNELEKQFFDTFGIEPKYEDACTVEDKYWANEELANEYGTFDQYMNCKCGNQENCTTECSCAYQKEIYPEITDRILLELICLNNIYLWEVHTNTVDELKNVLLNKYIEHVNLMADENEKQEYINQVQSLFKENNE